MQATNAAAILPYPICVEGHLEQPSRWSWRRGFPLIGWWLAGIPQYLIAAMFVGAGALGFWGGTSWIGGISWIGLIGLLVPVGAIVLVVRGTYPQSIFDLVLGLNRWVLRVLACAALMSTAADASQGGRPVHELADEWALRRFEHE